MKTLFFAFFFILFSFVVYGAEITAQLNLLSPPSVLKEGDVVEGLIKVWPLENADLGEFKKLEDKPLGNSLYVSQIESVETSANNADVVEAKILFIVKRNKENMAPLIDYKGTAIPLQLPELNLAPEDKDPAEYFIMNQKVDYLNIGLIIASGLLVLVVLIFALKRKTIKNLINNLRSDPVAIAKKKYDALFIKANKREDFEEIYASKDEWFKLVEVKAPAYMEFFEVMNLHQYKRFWSTEDLREVQSSFDVIRRSFK